MIFSLSALLVDRRYVFSLLKLENDLSANAEDGGITRKRRLSLPTSL